MDVERLFAGEVSPMSNTMWELIGACKPITSLQWLFTVTVGTSGLATLTVKVSAPEVASRQQLVGARCRHRRKSGPVIRGASKDCNRFELECPKRA
jgi:hypothetical protein